MEVCICSSKDESALCTLSIPNNLLYAWYLTRTDGCYSEKLNSCISARAMMLRKTHRMEERIRVQASRCYYKATRIPGRKKREKMLSGFSTFQVYQDDVIQPLEMKEQLSMAAIEADESRCIIQ